VSDKVPGPFPETDSAAELAFANTGPDSRSPLERFRTQPKKSLSVTDLVSPAWCELQYWYALSRYGRKRRTPAMEKGSAVHKKLEDQTHTTVKVDIVTKEDAWGLRIWNTIQGLRTLRQTGQTRELEIWGTIDGLVVNGVIDELSYICPDKALEDSLQKIPQVEEPPQDQPKISGFLKPIEGTSFTESFKNDRHYQSRKIYISDVKTRSVRSLPTEAAFRPTKMQLMLYHNLTLSLATNSVDFSILTSRYNLDSLKNFSDLFIAEVGSLNDDGLYDNAPAPNGSQESVAQWSQDSVATLLAHNCLSALWSLMITEFQITLPDGAESLGNILKAEYRSNSTGEIRGYKSFMMDETELKAYVDHQMLWWKGERKPQGVVIEEAFKCRSCEFADSCEWRIEKIQEAKEKARLSRRRTSAA
jgi:exonuclease V